MLSKAPRRPARLWRRGTRGAWLALYLWAALFPLPLHAAHQATCTKGDGPHIRKVCLTVEHTSQKYGHDVLGSTPEWNALTVFWGVEGQKLQDGRRGASELLNSDHVFEDIQPRLIDMDGNGLDEIVVVQSSFTLGARLLVISTVDDLKITATPYIGTRFRWLAPIGAADLDGDGHVEIAYIDRPHLAKTLRIWRYENGKLTEIATLPGLTNHKIGEDFISGGIRDCGTGPELILASADWSRIIAVSYTDDWTKTDLGPLHSADSLKAALTC